MIENPKVTIGIPVYNGEKIIEERIKQILSQTFQDFVIIISDNCSTDQTQQYCEDFIKKNERIIYYRQKKNRGTIWNANFLINKAKSDFFVIAAVDDIWDDDFLEKNIKVLENNKNVVGSIGEYKLFTRIKDPNSEQIKINVIENTKKFQYVHPVNGNIEQKIKFLLNYSMGGQVFSVFRTKKLQKANIFGYYNGWMMDLALILNVIKDGDLEVTKDAIMYKHVTERSTSIIKFMINQKYNFIKIIFLEGTFTLWCLKNLGLKNFLKNFKFFVKLNIRGSYVILAETTRICKRMLSGQEKYW